MSDSTPEWYDDEAGPLVRLYAMTAGRAHSTGGAFDLMAVVQAGPPSDYAPSLPPEQAAILRACRYEPQTVADVASESTLPVSVVRVLLGDLLESGHISVTRPVRPTELPDRHILREVIDGLRAL